MVLNLQTLDIIYLFWEEVTHLSSATMIFTKQSAIGPCTSIHLVASK